MAKAEKFVNQFLGNLIAFKPKLIFVVNTNDGIPMDACLGLQTRIYLQNLIGSIPNAFHGENLLEELEHNSARRGNFAGCRRNVLSQRGSVNESKEAVTSNDVSQQDYLKVEVPLRHDYEFFHLLNVELSGLRDLQSHERSELTKEICALGREISTSAASPNGSNKIDFYVWREILSLYRDCAIFFSANEQDEFYRDTATAQTQLQKFSEKLSEIKAAKKFRRKESYLAMDRFLYINLVLLRNLKFQELNLTAMTKILKSKSLELTRINQQLMAA